MYFLVRYFTVIAIPGSFASKLPFRTKKSAFFWSLGIISCVAIMNIHLLVLAREYELDVTEDVTFKNATFNITIYEFTNTLLCYSYQTGYQISPNWENIHLIIYNLVPFCIMAIFNGLLIKNVLLTSHSGLNHKDKKSNANSSQTKSQRKKKSLTISLVLVTILFLVMTLPSSIIFGFFYDFFDQNFGRSFLLIVDYLSFMNSSSIFFISLITNPKFRQVVFSKLKQLFGLRLEKKQPRMSQTKNELENTVS